MNGTIRSRIVAFRADNLSSKGSLYYFSHCNFLTPNLCACCVRSSTQMKNWAGNIVFGDSETVHPTSIDELVAIVAREKKVRARGSGHWYVIHYSSVIIDSNSRI